MNWVRFQRESGVGFGCLSNDSASVQIYDGDLFDDPRPTGEIVQIKGVVLLAPVRPGKIIGLWNNFHALAKKLNYPIPSNPLWFMKSPTSVIGPEGAIVTPSKDAGRIVYEGELAIVIGRHCNGVSDAKAEQAIFGYTCINDVTAIGILSAESSFAQWSRAKSFATFAPLGPCISQSFDWHSGRVRTLIDGRERQNYELSDMIFSPSQIVSFLSHDVALEPGDVIACGTSLGSLPMRQGSKVEVAIDGIGILRNTFEGGGV